MNAIVKLALLAAPSAIATALVVRDLNRGARRQIESIGSSGAVTTARLTEPAARARAIALLPELEEKQKTLPHGL